MRYVIPALITLFFEQVTKPTDLPPEPTNDQASSLTDQQSNAQKIAVARNDLDDLKRRLDMNPH